MSTRTRLQLTWMLVFLLTAPSAWALTAEPADDSETEVAEQEGAMYGRLRYLEGVLSIRRGSEVIGDLVPNEPIAPGDALVTGPDGRAEIQLADGSIVRVDHDTELVLQSLSDDTGRLEDTTILQLAHGSILVHAVAMESADKRFQIDTDTASAFLLSEGIFRLDAEPGVTYVRSRRGAAEVTSNDASSMLRSGERVAVRAGEMPGEAHVLNTRMGDDFDAWSDDRDNALLRTVRQGEEQPEELPEPVQPYATELSYYGRWQNTPTYGWVWSPVNVAATWQPYVYGRWTWSPAGMVWVSYEPWGWAPFHYGRWDYAVGIGWVWIPGYVFAGAHVAWSVAPGYFGWCPLGYYDYPVSYSVSFGWHHDPWVYVRADRIYTHRVNTVVVRDTTVIREIHRQAVVVRGHPRIMPHRVASGPAFTEELHRNFSRRPDLQLRPPSDSERRVAFRDAERQKLMRVAGRQGVRNVRPGRSGRLAEIPVADPTISTPRPRTMQPARPTYVRGQGQRPTGVGSGTPVRRDEPRRIPSTATPQRVSPGDERTPSDQPAQRQGGQGARRDDPAGRFGSPVVRGQGSRTESPRPENARPQEARPQSGYRQPESRPPQSYRAPEQRRGTGSAPERVIPRIIPRPRQETPRAAPPPSARPAAPRPAPGPARAQAPAPRPSAPPARPQGQGQGNVRGHGGNNKGKKDKD